MRNKVTHVPTTQELLRMPAEQREWTRKALVFEANALFHQYGHATEIMIMMTQAVAAIDQLSREYDEVPF